MYYVFLNAFDNKYMYLPFRPTTVVLVLIKYVKTNLSRQDALKYTELFSPMPLHQLLQPNGINLFVMEFTQAKINFLLNVCCIFGITFSSNQELMRYQEHQYQEVVLMTVELLETVNVNQEMSPVSPAPATTWISNFLIMSM